MKVQILGATLASALLAFSVQAPAQTATDRPADAATQPSSSSPSAAEKKKDDAASMGSSTAPASDKTFTHGESKRCESLAGADKELCDKEEATKTEGAAAEEASRKPEESSAGSSK